MDDGKYPERWSVPMNLCLDAHSQEDAEAFVQSLLSAHNAGLSLSDDDDRDLWLYRNDGESASLEDSYI